MSPPKAMVSRASNRKPSSAPGRVDRVMILDELMKAIPVEKVAGETGRDIRGVAVDSRQVDHGFIFVAMEGQATDGHLYLSEAIERGAVAVVSERDPEDMGVTWVQTADARKAAGLLSARCVRLGTQRPKHRSCSASWRVPWRWDVATVRWKPPRTAFPWAGSKDASSPVRCLRT